MLNAYMPTYHAQNYADIITQNMYADIITQSTKELSPIWLNNNCLS